jgi:hypothetical protein
MRDLGLGFGGVAVVTEAFFAEHGIAVSLDPGGDLAEEPCRVGRAYAALDLDVQGEAAEQLSQFGVFHTLSAAC